MRRSLSVLFVAIVGVSAIAFSAPAFAQEKSDPLPPATGKNTDAIPVAPAATTVDAGKHLEFLIKSTAKVHTDRADLQSKIAAAEDTLAALLLAMEDNEASAVTVGQIEKITTILRNTKPNASLEAITTALAALNKTEEQWGNDKKAVNDDIAASNFSDEDKKTAEVAVAAEKETSAAGYKEFNEIVNNDLKSTTEDKKNLIDRVGKADDFAFALVKSLSKQIQATGFPNLNGNSARTPDFVRSTLAVGPHKTDRRGKTAPRAERLVFETARNLTEIRYLAEAGTNPKTLWRPKRDSRTIPDGSARLCSEKCCNAPGGMVESRCGYRKRADENHSGSCGGGSISADGSPSLIWP